MKIFRLMICALGIALGALPVGSLRAADAPSSDAATASKDYVVFFGLDVFARDRGKLRPVVGGSEREVLVLNDDGDATVSLRDVPLTTEVEPKLSRTGFTIEGLEGYPVHSPAANPVADAQSQLIAMQNIDADRQEASEQAMRQAQAAAVGAVEGAALVPADSPDRGAALARADAANAQLAAAGMQVASVIANPQFGDFLPGEDTKDGSADGFEVTFRVHALEPSSDVYGVLRLFVRQISEPQSPARQALKVFRLRTLDAKPRKVIVRRFGLPAGSKVESYEIHLYAGGRELATNLSANRVQVTEDEALQFLILRHLHQHVGATLPPQVAEELRPDWPRAEIATEWGNATVNLRITAEGVLDEVNTGAAIGRPLTEELEGALRQVGFLPALVNGRPVASTGTFALGEIFLPSRQP